MLGAYIIHHIETHQTVNVWHLSIVKNLWSYNYVWSFPSHSFKFCFLLLLLLIYLQWTWAGPPLKLWLYWSTRSTRTWRGTRTNMVATICWPPTSTTVSACQLRNLQFPLQVSHQSVFEKRAWTTGSHLVGHMAVYLLISLMWHFCSSISVSSWLANLRDAHAVCHRIESNSSAKQPAPVPLQEYQQLQPRPGQLASFSWWRGAADHREQGESCCRWCVFVYLIFNSCNDTVLCLLKRNLHQCICSN